MSGESQQQPQAEPDPSVLVTDAIERAMRSERDRTDAKLETIRQRLTDIDKATELLHDTVNRTPTDIQTAVGHLKELIAKDIDSIKDAANKAEATNQKAIDKAEQNVKESGSGAAIQIGAQDKRISRIEDRDEGGKQVKTSLIVGVGVVSAVLGIIISMVTLNTLNRNQSPSDPTPIVVEVTVVSP